MFVENWWLTSRVSFSQFPTKKHPRKLLLISNYWALNQSVYPNIDFAGIYIPNIDFGEWSGICFGQILATREIPSPIQTWNKFGGDCFLLDSRRPYYRQVKTLTNAWNTPFSSWKLHCCVQVNSIASNIQTNPSTASLKLTTFASGVGGSFIFQSIEKIRGYVWLLLVSMRVTPNPKTIKKPPYLRCNEENPSQGRGEGCKSQQEGCQDHLKNVMSRKVEDPKIEIKTKTLGLFVILVCLWMLRKGHSKRVRVPKSIWCVVKSLGRDIPVFCSLKVIFWICAVHSVSV